MVGVAAMAVWQRRANSAHERRPAPLRRPRPYPFEHGEPPHVGGEVLQPDLGTSAHQADAAHQLAAHRVRLIAEHVLDPGAHARAGSVALLFARAERPVARRAPVDAALVAPLGKVGFSLGGAVGAVGPSYAGIWVTG